MPENHVNGQLDFCKSEFSYQTYDVQIIELKNCLVNKRGFIYDPSSLKINKISLIDEHLYPKLFTTKHYFKNVYFKRKIAAANGKYLLAHDDWSNEHFHWFIDALPILVAVRDRIKDYILLLPDSPYVKDIGLQSLDFFDLRPKSIQF